MANKHQLSAEQIQSFLDDGYLIVPHLFDQEEADLLLAAAQADPMMKDHTLDVDDRSGRNSQITVWNHPRNDIWGMVSCSHRMVDAMEAMLGGEVYHYHSKLLYKKPEVGGAWEWHQDYPPWHTIDGMAEPRCIMASVFIDDCTAVTSPLLVAPGSHRHGLLDSKPHEDATGKGYELHHIDHATLERLAEDAGLEALIGPAGSVALVHCNLVHGSANNVSPWRRAMMYLIYNAVSNACTGTERPWYHNNRDFTPLEPLDEQCLKALG